MPRAPVQLGGRQCNRELVKLVATNPIKALSRKANSIRIRGYFINLH